MDRCIYTLLIITTSATWIVENKGEENNRLYSGKPECNNGVGQALLGHVAATTKAYSHVDCARQCNEHSNCTSLNYREQDGACELSSGHAGADCSSLTPVPGYEYYEQVSVSSFNFPRKRPGYYDI